MIRSSDVEEHQAGRHDGKAHNGTSGGVLVLWVVAQACGDELAQRDPNHDACHQAKQQGVCQGVHAIAPQHKVALGNESDWCTFGFFSTPSE